MKRRTFLQTSSMAALGTLALPNELNFLKKVKKVGIQLYTLRSLMDKDAMGTLTKVAKIGYKNIESNGYKNGKVYGMTVAEFRKALDGLGLETKSSHLGLDILRSNNWENALADANLLGQKYVVCPFLAENERKTIDQYKQLCADLNKAGESAKKAGLQLAYHNHDFEFKTLEGQIPFELMLKECDANLVKLELDLYWATKAGKDPIALFKANPGRFHLWHVKDMANTAEQEFAPVGSGVIDFKKIFENSKTAGMEYFFVEQDNHKNNQPIENITSSYNYLKKLRY
jgi:sugar phosphate isomerase/epimerase